MANKARRYHYSESLTGSSTTLTTDQTKVTLTFTPDASSTYVYIWSCDVFGNSSAYDVRVTLKNNAGTAIAASNHETKDVTADYTTLSGIAFDTFGASPTSQSILLTYSSENTALTSTIRNARIIAIKLTAADAYVENTADQTTTSSTLQTATTLTFTPATTGNYLILGSNEARISATGVSVTSQITYSGTAYSLANARTNDSTNYFSGLMQAAVGSLTATSKTVTLQWSNDNNSSTAYCRRARLLALRLDEFGESTVVANNTGSTTTSTTYVTKDTTGAVTTQAGLNYLVIGTATFQGSTGSPTTLSAGCGLSVNGTYVAENFQESQSSGYYAPSHFGAFTVKNAGASITANFDYKAETASVAAGASSVTLAVLLLDPEELYWVGGSGNWNSSTTTNWALTSGGTGGAGVPSSTTNVFFDGNSDSGGSPFTVTFNTGTASCKNLLVSSLDSSMTLAGDAALTVYGNLTFPASNLSVTATGAWSFLSTGSVTINTSGVSLVNDINFGDTTVDAATYTLAGNFTTSGNGKLVGGTLALSSYTLSCSTFESNNTTSRTINFGTGKIVVTSAAATTVWNTATVTNLTISGTSLVQLTGGGATTKTISAGTSQISFQLSTTAGTVAFTASNQINNLTIDNNSFTLSNIAISIYGNLTISGTSPTLTAGGNAWTFASTSGTKTITTSGKTLDFPITFNGVGGSWQLADNLTVGTTTDRTVTLTAGTLSLSSYTLTVNGGFSSSNSNNREINFGTGKILVQSITNNYAVWTATTTTGLTISGTSNVEVATSLNITINVNQGSSTTAGAISFYLNPSSPCNIAFAASSAMNDLRVGTAAFNIANIAISIYGNLLIDSGSSATFTAGANAITFAATSGTKTITTNGKVLDLPITFNGAGGTWQLQDALSVGVATSRAVTLTAGTLDIANNNFTIYGTFSAGGTTTRSIVFGTGKIVLSLAGTTSTTILNLSGSNITTTGTDKIVEVTGSGTLTRTLISLADEANTIDVNIAATAGVITLSTGFRDVTFAGSGYTITPSAHNVYGNLSVTGTSLTFTSTATAVTFATTTTQNIDYGSYWSNLPIAVTFAGTGTYTFTGNPVFGTAAVNRTTTLTTGTIDITDKTLTIYGIFASSGSGTRSITFGSTGKIDLATVAATATIWNTSTSTNLTYTGSGTVEVTGSAAITRTINASGTTATTEENAFNFRFIASGGTITLSASIDIGDCYINCAGCIFNFGTSISIFGDFEYVTSGTLTHSSNYFFSTGTSQSLILNGLNLDGPVTFDGTGTYNLVADTNIGTATNRAVTFTSGTFNLNGYILTIFGSFSSSNSNTRTLAFGSTGKIVINNGSGVNTTVFSTSTSTNFVATGSKLVEIIGGVAAVGYTVTPGNPTEDSILNFNILTTVATSTVNFTSNDYVNDIYINSTGTVTFSNQLITGNYERDAGTVTATALNFVNTTGKIQTYHNGGSSGNYDITLNAPGGTLRILENLVILQDLTITEGTFDSNNYNVTVGSLLSNNANTRTILMGTGAWVLTLAGGIIWNTTDTTNLTFDKSTANITIQGTTASTTYSFYGGGLTFNELLLGGTNQTAVTFTIYGSNTFSRIYTTKTVAFTLSHEANTTNTYAAFEVSGSSGQLVTLRSTSSSVKAVLAKSGGGVVGVNYLAVNDIQGSPSNTWYAGGFSTDGNDNTDVYFYNPPLYWIGGTGTWTTSSTTNWSRSSGGTSSGIAPDGYTPVVFDANSDSGSPFTVTLGSSTVFCRDFTASSLDQAMTLTGSVSSYGVQLAGGIVLHASNFSISGITTGDFSFQPYTNDAYDIDTKGIAIPNVEFTNTVGATYTLLSNLNVTADFIFDGHIIDLNDFNITAANYNLSSTVARTLDFASSSKLVWTGTSTFNAATLTALTITGTAVVDCTNSSGTTRNFAWGTSAGLTSTNAPNVNVTAGTGSFNVSTSAGVRTLDFTGSFTGTWNPFAIFIYGGLILNSSMTVSASASTVTFNNNTAAPTTYYINTYGKDLQFPITFTNTGSTLSLLSNVTVGGVIVSEHVLLTHTSGTIAFGNYNITLYGNWNTSSSSVRSYTTSGGKIIIANYSTTAITVWTSSTTTNLTNADNILIEIYGNGSTKTVTPGNPGESNMFSYYFALDSGSTLSVTNLDYLRNVTIANTSQTISVGNFYIYGNLLIEGTTPTLTGITGFNWIFAKTSGTQTANFNGKSLPCPLTKNGAGSLQLLSALTLSGTSTSGLLTLDEGDIDLNDYTLTCNTVSITNQFNTSFNFKTNGKLVVTGSGSAFTSSSQGGKFSYAGNSGIISMTSTSAKTFNGGMNQYPVLSQDGTGPLTIQGSSPPTTFYNIKNTVQPCNIVFTAGYTCNVYNFQVSGTSNTNLVYVISDLSGTQFVITKDSGTVSAYYLHLDSSQANGGATWIAYNSVDNGYNSGWSFQTFTPSGAAGEMFFVI